MDLSRHTVSDDGREVKLTAKEFLLLQYLLEHRGRVLSRDLLLGGRLGLPLHGRHAHRRRARPAAAGEAADAGRCARHGETVRLQARGERGDVTLGFRTKVFLASLGVAAAALALLTVIVALRAAQRRTGRASKRASSARRS